MVIGYGANSGNFCPAFGITGLVCVHYKLPLSLCYGEFVFKVMCTCIVPAFMDRGFSGYGQLC
jgi:hypothetical protein